METHSGSAQGKAFPGRIDFSQLNVIKTSIPFDSARDGRTETTAINEADTLPDTPASRPPSFTHHKALLDQGRAGIYKTSEPAQTAKLDRPQDRTALAVDPL